MATVHGGQIAFSAIGGGNSAIDCARASCRLGAEVTLIYRRGEAQMPAHPKEVQMAREEGAVCRDYVAVMLLAQTGRRLFPSVNY